MAKVLHQERIQVGDVEYEISPHPIGEGGFSEIYRLIAKGYEDRVAKVLKEDLLGSGKPEHLDARKRFAQEITILRSLDPDKGIISCYSPMMQIGDRPGFVLEYLPLNLKQLLKKENLSVKQKLELAVQILDSLLYVHEQGVIHRDIKPQNILLSRDDLSTPKIADFGAAKRLREPMVNTDPGKLIGQTSRQYLARNIEEGVLLDYIAGTWGYMPPEMVSKMFSRRDVGVPGFFHHPGVDIFGFGVMLYRMLTGKNDLFEEHNFPSNLKDTVRIEENKKALDHIWAYLTIVREVIESKFARKMEKTISNKESDEVVRLFRKREKNIFYHYNHKKSSDIINENPEIEISFDLAEFLEWMLSPSPTMRAMGKDVLGGLKEIIDNDY